jgi:hypothetical protein
VPVTTHPNITTPPGELSLWRYSNFTKFVSLISTRTLWFARADLLGDPFELSVPQWVPALTYNSETEQLEQMPPEMIEKLAAGFRQVRSWVTVNCWYSGDRDSAAMWTTFGSAQDGVAVRSSVDQLRNAVQFEKDLYIGAVSYFDYGLADVPPQAESIDWGNQLSYTFMKRDAFQHEKEIRAVVWDRVNTDLQGHPVPVDLSTLIDEVTVAPFAEQWFVELVERYLEERGLEVPVARSDIGSEPNWRFSVPPSFQHLPVAQFGTPGSTESV